MQTLHHNSTGEIVVTEDGNYSVGTGPTQWTQITDPLTTAPLAAQSFVGNSWVIDPIENLRIQHMALVATWSTNEALLRIAVGLVTPAQIAAIQSAINWLDANPAS